MTLLHSNYTSGNILTAGSTGVTGTSGLNAMAERINFGGFDFPEVQTTTYVTDSGLNIVSGLVVGTNQSYVITGSYNLDQNPIEVIFSGTTLGSVVTHSWGYQTGSNSPNSTGSLISGNIVLS